MYKFMSHDDYIKSNYANTHPFARVNEEKTEVVLSCSRHSNCSCITHAEAVDYINKNWKSADTA